MSSDENRIIEKRYPFGFGIIGIFLGILLGLVVSETVLRLMVKFVLNSSNRYVGLINSVESGSLYRESDDPILAYEFRPSSQCSGIRINSAGFRGREYDKQVAPGVTRVAILGDSESVGLLLPEEHTFFRALEKTLNELHDGKRYEVIDCSVPGYNIDQKVRVLEKALSYHPAAVIFYYVFNDPEPYPNGVFIEDSPLRRSYLFLLLRYSLDLARPSIHQMQHQDRSLTEYYERLHESPDFDRCKQLITLMGTFLTSHKIKFIVVIAPELLGVADFGLYPYLNIHAKLQTLSSPAIKIVDPLEALAASGYKPAELWVTRFDCHKNKTANEIIATYVSKHAFSSMK